MNVFHQMKLEFRHAYIIISDQMKICSYPSCAKSLSTTYKLKLHIERCHLNIKRFRCKDCLKEFKSSDSLKRHTFKHRSAEVAADSLVLPSDHREVIIYTDESFEIPKLTRMLRECQDPDLRPNSRVLRMYPFVHNATKEILPPIL